MKSAAIRVAILDADVLYQSLQARYHSYGVMFTQALKAAGVTWKMPVFSVIDGEYPSSLDDFDACLITGSKYDSFSDEAWVQRLRAYARELCAAGKPIVGICFGHQLLAHALGGEAAPSAAGWGLGVMRYQLAAQPGFVDTNHDIGLIVSHKDQVRQLPPQATLLMRNDFCPNAAFFIPDCVLAVQGHPEFSVDYASDLLDFRADQLPPDLLAAARRSLQQAHDGPRVVGWIREFVQQALLHKSANIHEKAAGNI